jgi:hypothetical protein
MSAALIHSLALLSLAGWVIRLLSKRRPVPAWLWVPWALALLINLHPWLVSLASRQELARLTPIAGQTLELEFLGARITDWECRLTPRQGVPAAGDWPTRYALKAGFNGQALDPDLFMEDSSLRILLPETEALKHNRLSLAFAADRRPGPLVITVLDLEYHGFGMGLLRGLLWVAIGHALVLLPLVALGWRSRQRL